MQNTKQAKQSKYKIKYNPELNADINQLKELHALKDKSRFNALKSELMLKYNMSKATVYREMRKPTPGLYKILNYKPPKRDVTEKEIAMVKELLARKIPVMDISAIMESETGDKYDWDRIDKIRLIIDSRFKDDEAVNRGNPGYGSSSNNPDNPGYATNFGSSVKRLCEEALKCNLMSPDSHVEFKCDGKTYQLCFNDVQDIVMICSNAVVREKDGFFDYVNYAYEKIWQLFFEKVAGINSANEISTKELIEIKNAFEEFEKRHMESFCKNFSVIWGVAHELSPKTSYSKIFELTEKNSRLFPECKISECECLKELKRKKRTGRSVA
ncbi:MAG: hypothetical protein ACHQHP_06080 [Bacteroidia bacterium]